MSWKIALAAARWAPAQRGRGLGFQTPGPFRTPVSALAPFRPVQQPVSQFTTPGIWFLLTTLLSS